MVVSVVRGKWGQSTADGIKVQRINIGSVQTPGAFIQGIKTRRANSKSHDMRLGSKLTFI